jgi:hypothetical protein
MEETPAGRYLFESASLLLGLLFGFASYFFGQDLQLSLMLGLIVSVGLLTVKVIAELARVARTGADAGRALDDIKTSLHYRDRYLATLDHVAADPSGALARTLERIHTSMEGIPPPLFGVVVHLLDQPVDQLERRHIVTTAEASSLNSHLVRTFTTDVFTTSVFPMEFWLTPYGMNYNDAICARLADLRRAGHGVRFRRVFIARESHARELLGSPYADVIRKQLDSGVEVRIAFESQLPPELRIDFGIWDGNLEVELEVDDGGHLVRRHYRYAGDAIAAAQRRAEQIWDRGIDFTAWSRLN